MMDDELKEYRKQLLETEQKVGESFHKTILTLSGGALGISFVFIKNVVGKGSIISPNFLIYSWGLFTISLASVLLAQYFGILSYRRAIKQVDKNTIYNEHPGGIWALLMPILNFFSTFSFISGVVLLLIFGFKNIGG